MAHYQNQYGEATRTDEYGNPVHETGATTGYGTNPYYGSTTTTNTTGTGHHGLHRTGSSSSSSSEDEVDENGVRRKKGMKEKIKEKIPGVDGHSRADDRSHATSTTTPGGYEGAGEHHHEKKGIMGKIKEKLPGHN